MEPFGINKVKFKASQLELLLMWGGVSGEFSPQEMRTSPADIFFQPPTTTPHPPPPWCPWNLGRRGEGVWRTAVQGQRKGAHHQQVSSQLPPPKKRRQKVWRIIPFCSLSYCISLKGHFELAKPTKRKKVCLFFGRHIEKLTYTVEYRAEVDEMKIKPSERIHTTQSITLSQGRHNDFNLTISCHFHWVASFIFSWKGTDRPSCSGLLSKWIYGIIKRFPLRRRVLTSNPARSKALCIFIV